MHNAKNIKLIILLLALMVLSVILMTRGYRKQRLAVDENYFSVKDTSGIDRIVIQSTSFENMMTRSGKRWEINGKYLVDASMKTVLLTVLHKVRAQRPVPIKHAEEIIKDLSGNGTQVSIYSNNELIQSYITAGNGVSISYFMKKNEDPYIVHLPGYDSYVSGIFEVTENDWRDRFIFSTNWIGLKKLTLQYPDSSDHGFTIEMADTRLKIKEVTKLDTTFMMKYIELFAYFQVDQFIKASDNPRYDSIFNTKPYALLSIDDTSFDIPMVVKFYIHDIADPLMPCLVGDQPAIMSAARIKPIFKKRSDFIM